MDIGLDSFALHPLGLDPRSQLDWAAAHGFAGVQFGDVSHLADSLGGVGGLSDLRLHADGLGLYTHVSVGICNPYAIGQSEVDLVKGISQRISMAAGYDWHELHSVLGGPENRAGQPVPWAEQLAATTRVLRFIAKILRGVAGSRINLETHGDATTFELVRLVEEIGPDVLGICLDTANVVLHGEHPTLAARRAAPYTHLTHCKDAIVYFVDNGLRRQTLPAGAGIIDWREVISALAAHQPDLKLSIEDHKWLCDAQIFEADWMRQHPDTPRDELLTLLAEAHRCTQQIRRGQLREPDEYEQIPYGDEVESRLIAGRDHLQQITSHLSA